MVQMQLSLAGDGRLVILTPQTVRAAFFKLTSVNQEYTSREKFPLNRPIYKPFKLWKDENKRDGSVLRTTYAPSRIAQLYWKETEATLLDALYRKYLDREKLSHLHKKDIQYIEREINKQIIRNNLALVDEEGLLLLGYGICQEIGKNREKVKYIRRYGMIFILEPITRQTVLKAENIDLFLQDTNFDFHLVRYQGVLLSALRSRLKLLFRHRLDFSITWTCTLDSFQPRQIFRITRIYPCDGFRIVNYG
ncbi:hypothetical protein NIES4103_05000 [Nostoc sp. NIES-4103]|nr:hypothetical protein NIES4103_05000 [Nostoc sp. NIES-4103]